MLRQFYEFFSLIINQICEDRMLIRCTIQTIIVFIQQKHVNWNLLCINRG